MSAVPRAQAKAGYPFLTDDPGFAPKGWEIKGETVYEKTTGGSTLATPILDLNYTNVPHFKLNLTLAGKNISHENGTDAYDVKLNGGSPVDRTGNNSLVANTGFSYALTPALQLQALLGRTLRDLAPVFEWSCSTARQLPSGFAPTVWFVPDSTPPTSATKNKVAA